MARISKYEGRTMELIQETESVRSQKEVISGLSRMWGAIKFEYPADGSVRLSVWGSMAAPLYSKPAYVYVIK